MQSAAREAAGVYPPLYDPPGSGNPADGDRESAQAPFHVPYQRFYIFFPARFNKQ